MQKNQSHFNTKINTSQNNFATAPMDINKTMKVEFNSTDTAYSNIGFHKTSNDFSPDTHIKPTDEDIYYTTLVSVIEMIKTGTTCFNDMYFFPHFYL